MGRLVVTEYISADGVIEAPSGAEPFERGGKKNGTRVTAWPDGKYFDSPNIPMSELQRLLRSKAVLLPGVTVTLTNAKTGDKQTWRYDEGLRGYLTESLAQTAGGHGLDLDSPELASAFSGGLSTP